MPGVTTVLQGWGFGSQGLLGWQRKLFDRGLDPNKIRDEAGEIGTLCHQLIEDWWNETPSDISQNGMTQYQLAEAGFYNFAHWAREGGVRKLATEVKLVSEAYRFGGSIDRIALQDNDQGQAERILVDYKTSKFILATHKIQVAAYKLAWEECHPDEPISRALVVKVGRARGQLAAYALNQTECETATAAFIHLRHLYDAEKVLSL